MGTAENAILHSLKGYLADRELRNVLEAIQHYETFQKDLRSALVALHAHAYELLGKKAETVDGIGLVERTAASSDVWDDEAVLKELAAHAPLAVHPDSGELTLDGVAFADLIFKCMKPAYWRVKALEEAGIKPNDFRTRKWGARKVRITPQTAEERQSGL